MIEYVDNKKIDIKKYDKCIATSLNSRVYVYSWYLDCVTDSWDVLILNDYEAVMPLPRRKKYGLNYIYQVPWVQQLGIFSKTKINEFTIVEFMKKIPKRFVLVDYSLNSKNVFSSKYATKRINFLLELNSSFEEIIKGYNKNRRRITNHDFTDYFLDKNGRQKEFIDLYINQNLKYKTHKDSLVKLQNLLNKNYSEVHIWNVYKNGELLAGLVWLKDEFRITYLLPVATDQAKKDNIPTFIINELVKEYQNTSYTLDFEGSMIKGVANFYKSFGAEEEIYYWYKKMLVW